MCLIWAPVQDDSSKGRICVLFVCLCTLNTVPRCFWVELCGLSLSIMAINKHIGSRQMELYHISLEYSSDIQMTYYKTVYLKLI